MGLLGGCSPEKPQLPFPRHLPAPAHCRKEKLTLSVQKEKSCDFLRLSRKKGKGVLEKLSPHRQ